MGEFLGCGGEDFCRIRNLRKGILDKYGDNPIFIDKPSFCLAENVFFLEETCRWSYIVENAGDNKIANMLDIEKDNKTLQGALLPELSDFLDVSHHLISKVWNNYDETI